MLTISSRLNVAIVSCTRKRAVTANLKAHKCRGWGGGADGRGRYKLRTFLHLSLSVLKKT